MNQATILFVHVGPSELPEHLPDTVSATVAAAPQSKVVLLSHQKNLNAYRNKQKFHTSDDSRLMELVAVEDIPMSDTTATFLTRSKLNQDFRDGFWFHASERFYRISDYMQYSNIENCLHLENDVQIYFDPTVKIDVFRNFADFGVPLDRVRAIPGIVWIKHHSTAVRLASELLASCHENDMISIGKFCMNNQAIARPLPSIPPAYADWLGLDKGRYCQGIGLFEGVFDCAAIGQYLGGVDRVCDPDDTRFFVNESSELDLRKMSFSWDVANGTRRPMLTYANIRTPVLSIHAHSKNLKGISPTNVARLSSAALAITGERLQSACDLTISSSAITAFHGRDKIRSKRCIELPQEKQWRFLAKKKAIIPPDEHFISVCRSAKSFFLYTHLLDYFEKYIAPRLHQDFVLVTHNSDAGVDLSNLRLLNQPNLMAWFAQNANVAHGKLIPIPIGMANSQWGETRVDYLIDVSRNTEKRKTLFANFNVATHHSRSALMVAIKDLPDVTTQSGASFDDYARELSLHKFCLCPRGNGLDTHRFWEAQYLNCIPVIVKEDWIAAYSGLPVLILDSWAELANQNFEEHYIRISTLAFDRKTLYSDYFATLIADCANGTAWSPESPPEGTAS